MRTSILLIYLMALSVMPSMAQTLRGKILSSQNQDPVAEAFVFISNSNNGVLSNEHGYFEIEVKHNTEVTLTISQINYQLKTIKVDPQWMDIVQITLDPKENEISGVELSRKYNPKLREKRLKKFTVALLGDDYKKRGVNILNNDKILLYEENDYLRVQVEEPLEIKNEYLGYMIKFYLSDFYLYKDNSTSYIGTAFFEELDLSKKERAKALKNRRTVYRRSKRDFISSLFFDRKNEEYQVFIKNEDPETKHISEYLPSDSLSSQLEITLSSKTKKIDLDSELKIYDIKYNTLSYLLPKSGMMRIDMYGNIINSNEIEESGYWTENRMSALLPYDYVPN